jgi:hypothetical protein
VLVSDDGISSFQHPVKFTAGRLDLSCTDLRRQYREWIDPTLPVIEPPREYVQLSAAGDEALDLVAIPRFKNSPIAMRLGSIMVSGGVSWLTAAARPRSGYFLSSRGGRISSRSIRHWCPHELQVTVTTTLYM